MQLSPQLSPLARNVLGGVVVLGGFAVFLGVLEGMHRFNRPMQALRRR
jgi:hypothetical protein